MEFVKARCGVIRAQLMPSSTMFQPLADLLAPDRAQRGDLRDDLERWFWATAFAQAYSQGANTQAVADARALRAWQADANAVPDSVQKFWFDGELLKDGRRRNEMLVRGLLCWSVTQNARDWVDDVRFQDSAAKLEIHHVFPDEYLGKHHKGHKDPVANFVLLTESTNKKLRNTLPKDVLVRTDVSKEAITSHPAIELSLLEEDAGVAGSRPPTYRDSSVRARPRSRRSCTQQWASRSLRRQQRRHSPTVSLDTRAGAGSPAHRNFLFGLRRAHLQRCA
jgi:hypothetical protein